jgi:colanic acid biosynthesis protein WcaH
MPLGLYDHFYDDSVFGEEVSTHYINAPYLIELSETDTLNLPSEQHRQYRWVKIEDLACDDSIHRYSKVFLDYLCDRLSNADYLDPKKLVNVKC